MVLSLLNCFGFRPANEKARLTDLEGCPTGNLNKADTCKVWGVAAGQLTDGHSGSTFLPVRDEPDELQSKHDLGLTEKATPEPSTSQQTKTDTPSTAEQAWQECQGLPCFSLSALGGDLQGRLAPVAIVNVVRRKSAETCPDSAASASFLDLVLELLRRSIEDVHRYEQPSEPMPTTAALSQWLHSSTLEVAFANSALLDTFAMCNVVDILALLEEIILADPGASVVLQEALRNLYDGEPSTFVHVIPRTKRGAAGGELLSMKVTPCICESASETKFPSLLLSFGRFCSKNRYPSAALLRDHKVLASVPHVITVFDFEGNVLYQNSHSKELIGDFTSYGRVCRCLSEPDNALTQLFKHDLALLDDMLESLIGGRQWSGLVRVGKPARSTISTQPSVDECLGTLCDDMYETRPLPGWERKFNSMSTDFGHHVASADSVQSKLHDSALSFQLGSSGTSSITGGGCLQLGTLLGYAEVAQSLIKQAADLPYAWHEFQTCVFYDPYPQEHVMLVVQKDVTARVLTEQHASQLCTVQMSLLGENYQAFVDCFREPDKEKHNTLDLDRHPPWTATVPTQVATRHEQVTVLFASIVGFTAMCNQLPAPKVLGFLNQLYVGFDMLLKQFDLHKLDMIGDSYVVAGTWLGEESTDSPAKPSPKLAAAKVFEFAKAMLCFSNAFMSPQPGQHVKLRIGLHTGALITGTVGTSSPRFSVMGDAMQLASRLELACPPACILASWSTCALLDWAPAEKHKVMVDVGAKGTVPGCLWSPDW